MSQNSWIRVGSFLTWPLASLALLGFFLVGLDHSILFDVDEGAFTEATREMLVSRDWGHTTLNGLDRFDKPIGVYWLQALSASIFGLSEFSFRLPSALSGWIAALALAFFAKDKWGNHAAFMTAVISATSLGPWAMARTATADALLGLCFVLIFLDLWRSIETQRIEYVRRLAVWIGLGLLVKGPVAVVVPLGTVLIYSVLSPKDRAFVKSMFLDTWSWFLLISVSLPWYLYAYLRHGQFFLNGFLLKHNLERFTGSLEGHSGDWTYFLFALPLLWLPWSVMWFKSLLDFKDQWAQSFFKFCWIWFAFVFVFFTFANTKLPHYLLYAGPAMCFLIFQGTQKAGRQTWLLTWILAVSSLIVLIFLPSYLQNHIEIVREEYYRALLENSLTGDMLIWSLVIPLFFVISPFVNLILNRSNSITLLNVSNIGFVSLAFYQSFVLALVVLPWWSQVLQSPVYILAMKYKNSTSTIVQWGVHFPSFATYSQRESPRREPRPGELALVKNIKPHWPEDWEIVDSKGPLAIVKMPSPAQQNP
jgi:4-amino-4-deoxy-L-arabinose transferase-like glycosyltransferase